MAEYLNEETVRNMLDKEILKSIRKVTDSEIEEYKRRLECYKAEILKSPEQQTILRTIWKNDYEGYFAYKILSKQIFSLSIEIRSNNQDNLYYLYDNLSNSIIKILKNANEGKRYIEVMVNYLCSNFIS